MAVIFWILAVIFRIMAVIYKVMAIIFQINGMILVATMFVYPTCATPPAGAHTPLRQK
jgi:hypothetical protein